MYPTSEVCIASMLIIDNVNSWIYGDFSWQCVCTQFHKNSLSYSKFTGKRQMHKCTDVMELTISLSFIKSRLIRSSAWYIYLMCVLSHQYYTESGLQTSTGKV
jgi:hypothetical protein